MSFNKIVLVGNLGKDPELRYTPQGDAVCSFNMATNERKKDKSGEYQDVTTWFKVTLWRRQAENASKYLVKGSAVYIEGRLQLEEWTDREDKNRYTLGVQATDMQFIGSRSDGGGDYNQSSGPTNYSQAPAADNFPTHSGGGPAPAEGLQTSAAATPASASPAPVDANPPVGADKHGSTCKCPNCDDIPF